MLSKLSVIRSYILIFTKIIGILICVYYISYASTYKVSWNLLTTWLFPSWVVSLNNLLSAVGTYILIIPLSIIISSLIIESKSLNIAACIFSVSGGLVSTLIGLANGTLKEYTNLKLLVIHHALSLETKHAIFINEFKLEAMSKCKDMQTKLDYVLSKLSEINFVEYDNTLIKLPATEIKQYSHRIVSELIIQYDNSQPSILKQIGAYIWHGMTFQNVAAGVIVVGILLGGFKIMIWLITDERASTGANLHKEGAVLSGEGSELTTAALKISTAIAGWCKTYVTSSFEAILNLLRIHETQLKNCNSQVHQFLKDDIYRENLILFLHTELVSLKAQFASLQQLLSRLSSP